MNKSKYRKGFTLLEILLVIVLIGILAAIILLAINPTRQISQIRDSVRASDINTIQKAIEQYSIDNGGQYPGGIPMSSYKEICGETIDSSCVDLSVLVPTYVADLPKEPNGNSYKVGINADNNRVSVWSELAESREVILNKFTVSAAILAGARDLSFNTGSVSGFAGRIDDIVLQADNKMIIGGSFTNYQGLKVNGIIRLNPDGGRDNSFNVGTGFDYDVITLARQSDDKIVIGGGFENYQGQGANYIIRLNADGSRDTSFDIGDGFDDWVNKIIVQADGKILAGGWFSSYKGQSANRIIRLNPDGSRDTSFDIGDGFDYEVKSILQQSDGKILITGYFTSYKGQSANSMIRLNLDGSRDDTFNIGSGFGGSPYKTFQQSDGKIVVGGWFSSYQGQTAKGLIRFNLDGSIDSTFNMGVGLGRTFGDPIVLTIYKQSDGKILVGGEFTTYQGQSSNNIVRINTDGSIDNTFNVGSGLNNDVLAVIQQADGKIVVGGGFASYQGQNARGIVRLNADGSRDTSFNVGSGTGFSGGIWEMIQQSDGKILFSGYFEEYQGELVTNLIRIGI